MMNTPTPPPWKVAQNYSSGGATVVIDSLGNLVAEVTWEADAALIAAAPLLRDACEAVLREDELAGGLLSRNSYLLLRAALLKAHGQE